MSKPAAIQATYATFRHIQGRKVLQIVFEVPEEKSSEVLAFVGAPNHESARWFAIAKLDPSVAAGTDSPAQRASGEMPIKTARAWKNTPRSQQAAIKLQDPVFCEWLTKAYLARVSIKGLGTPEEILKAVLGIQRKRDLDNPEIHPFKGEDWDRLLASFDYRERV